MLKTAAVIRHIHFEDLGTFEAVLTAFGYRIHYYDIGVNELQTLDPELPDLMVVLGGPVGVYETQAYPFLEEERQLLARRLASGRPILGICLGAQMIAAALGAKVAPMGHKEIGFSSLSLTEAGRVGPLRHLEGVPVLHWHGDAFEIPEGAESLAATPLCATQGFAIGQNVLGLQFHLEVNACAGIERWLVGHAAELASARIDPRALRADAMKRGPALRVNGGVKTGHGAEQKSATLNAGMRPAGGRSPSGGLIPALRFSEGFQLAFRARLWARR